MSTLPDVRGAHRSVDELPEAPATRTPDAPEGPRPQTAATPPADDAQVDKPRADRFARATQGLRLPLGAYALTRVLYLVIALVDLPLDKFSLGRELRNWDGRWYVELAEHGYPHTLLLHVYSPLGFFPLYSMLLWAIEHVLFCGYIAAGVILSLLTGAVATVLIYRLACHWWGESAARRAIVLFCCFPGTIVFSMVYTEGLLLTLVGGTLLALERRRWVTAGLLAGLATAVGPVGLVIIPVCAVVALRELRRRGWRDREARRALLAPLLSPIGIVAFGAYLWTRYGTPFATFSAQRIAWKEHSSPLALYWAAHSVYERVKHVGPLSHPGIDLNPIAGLLGAALLVYALYLLWRHRGGVPLAAAVWTLGVAVLAITSDQTPPNPRMLICAFPVVLVLAVRFTGRAYRRLLAASTFMLVVMSMLTFVSSSSLRP